MNVLSTRLFMIAGFMLAGKSTLAQMLVEEFTELSRDRTGIVKAEIVKIADPLYRTQEIFSSQKNRRFLQGLGDLARECFGADALELVFEDSVEDAYARKSVVICDDMRTPGELALAKRLGAVTVWVDADEAIRRERGEKLGTWSGSTHKTEQGLPQSEFDLVVFNHSNDIELLRSAAKGILQFALNPSVLGR